MPARSHTVDTHETEVGENRSFWNEDFFKKIYVFLFGQAAAHGLPMVATKNGGPVDIHKVLIFATHQFI